MSDHCSGPEHYRAAEVLLTDADDQAADGDIAGANSLRLEAIARAILANSSATAAATLAAVADDTSPLAEWLDIITPLHRPPPTGDNPA